MRIQKMFLTIFIICLAWPTRYVFADDATTSTSSAVSLATTTPSSTLNATTTPSTSSGLNGQGSVLGLQAPTVPPIIAAMKAAKVELAGVSLNHALTPVYKNVKNKKSKKITKTLTGYQLSAQDIALAILDPGTNNTIIIKGMQTGKSMTFNDPAVDVALVKFNGVNSKFVVNRPAGGQVVALKYLISKTDSGSKKSIEAGLSPAIYVPYSPDFAQPDVLAYGASYIDGVVAKAAGQLKYLHSQAIPGKDLTAAIPPAMIKALVYAEHTDTNTVLNGGDVQGTINQLNILFALNEGDAYNYSLSTAGARGIAQFIPSTYASLVSRHPEAGLTADFAAGMSNHVNAIKAMYLLLDDYAGYIRIKAASGFAEGHIFEYGAASYNGGTTRVANAVKTFGDNWNMDHSGEINALTSQVESGKLKVKSLKAQIKKTADKKAKAALNSQLAATQSQLADNQNQLDNLKSASLRAETINYLNKIYKVVHYFNDKQV